MTQLITSSLQPLAVGIDVGGTGTKFGIVDRNGNILFSGQISTRGHQQVESFMNDFIMITLGTGVGSGIVANGKLIYGHDGFAGELGHTIIIPNGRLHTGTGKYGSLESYASATGVRLTALEMLQNNTQDSLLRK